MNTAHITKLLTLGQLSLDLRAAELAADSAKSEYHAAWQQYELDGEVDDEVKCGIRYVSPDERIRQGHPLWHEAQDATEKHFAAYQAAKRAAYNVKRRWQNACRNAGNQGAQ